MHLIKLGEQRKRRRVKKSERGLLLCLPEKKREEGIKEKGLAFRKLVVESHLPNSLCSTIEELPKLGTIGLERLKSLYWLRFLRVCYVPRGQQTVYDTPFHHCEVPIMWVLWRIDHCNGENYHGKCNLNSSFGCRTADDKLADQVIRFYLLRYYQEQSVIISMVNSASDGGSCIFTLA